MFLSRLSITGLLIGLVLAGCQPMGINGSIPQNGVVAGTNTHAQFIVSDNGSRIAVSNTLNSASGQKVRVGFMHGMVNPDCSMNDAQKPVLKITGKPQHGQLTTADGESFPDFPPSSPFYKCNDTAMSGTDFYYTSQAGYIGSDTVLYTLFAPDGHEIDFTTTINIK